MSGLWCRAGALKLSALALALSALIMPSFGGCSLDPTGNDTTPTSAKCENAIHCDDNNPCTIDVCSEDGLCVATPVDGDPPSQPSGDCERVTCKAGAEVPAPDDADVDDGNACTIDECTNGAPTHSNADGAPCILGGGSGVCKAGACVVSCASATEPCDDDNPCTEDACDVEAGECVHDASKLHGTLVADRSLSDCVEQRCKDGVSTTVPDDSEIPDDQNGCTVDTCKAGAAVHANMPVDTACGVAGDLFCDNQGQCVQCNNPTQCGVNDDCNSFTCKASVCGDDFKPAGTKVSAQVTGDCQVAQCDGAGGVVSANDNTDLPDDGNDCTTDLCGAGMPSHSFVGLGAACSTILGPGACDGAGICKKGVGDPCAIALECSTNFCADGRCCDTACTTACKSCGLAGLEGTCSNIAAFGKDNAPANACTGTNSCDGAGACKKDNGQTCAAAGDCTSTNCVDGRCCNTTCTGTCLACNVAGSLGVCSNVPQLQDDTFPANACDGANSCDGAGACKKDNGQTCAAAVDCSSGNCVDGRCCNSACNGTCKSCSVTGLEGTCSNIPQFTEDTFPANACVGASSCDGAGGCKKDNGQTCATASDCSSGNCVDGRCCNTTCTGTCLACNVTGLEGTCSNIPQLQEDSFPANACVGSSSCDGAGGCKKDNGQSCAGAAECSSGNCVDGRCCNGACNTTCMACNVAGSLGTCTNIPALQDDTFPANACVGVSTCDGAGSCKQDNGQTCAVAAECASGNCVDGRCCNTTCTGTCLACNVTGLEGTCSNIPQLVEDNFPAGACSGVSSCDGAGGCKKDNGQTCGAAGECSSGNCVDGRCCNSTCNGTCLACNVSGLEGTCSNVPAGMDDAFPANACVGASSCDGAGGCKKDNGQTCGTGPECVSNNCVDGRCCNTTCTGLCKACNVPGVEGTCSNIPALTEDNFPAGTCVGTNSCDGNGACAKDNGQACLVAAECASGNCVDGRCCNTGCGTACMACNVAGLEGTCSNLPAGAEDMFPVNACVGVSSCDGAGGCKKDNGQACGAAAECSSGNCVDGLCCNTTCGTACQACNVAGLAGTCSNLPAFTEDTFPANACVGNNSCNGAGSCTKANGQACGSAAECSSGNCVDGFCCDTACDGTCLACNVSGSEGTCSNLPALVEDTFPTNACVAPSSCNGVGTCTKGNGQTCGGAAECSSGNCVDGVCCDTACSGLCSACSAAAKGAGVDGACGPIATGTDPDNECADDGAASCDQDGFCDGAGACRIYMAGTECAASMCSSGTQTNASTCDGSGNCNGNGLTSCAPYACGPSTCLTMCNMDNDCAPGNYCAMGGQCVAMAANGGACVGANECTSANCVDGVCCDSQCSGACSSCLAADTGLANGTCGFVTSGADPGDECTDTGASSCGTSGACDGSGACATYAAGTVCVMAACMNGTQQGQGTCNGSGQCVDPGMQICDPYVCDVSACKTSCSIDADCTSGNYCAAGGVCAAQLANGASCNADSECSNNVCTDGYCCDSACDIQCESCDGARTGGENGACLPVTQLLTDDAPACDGTLACDGMGACKRANGEACTDNAECASGNCNGAPAGTCM